MGANSEIGSFVALRRGTTYKGVLVGKPGPALLGLGSIVPGGGFRNDYKTYGGECPPELMLGPGDLYVSLKGATKAGDMIGSVARVPDSVTSGRLTQDTVRLVFGERDAAFERYLYWLLRTPDYRTYCAGRATGSAVAALSREDFLSYPVPPLTEYGRRIVDTLEKIEEKIGSNRHLISAVSDLLDTIADRVSKELESVTLSELVKVTHSAVDPARLKDAQVDHFSLPAFDQDVWPERVAPSSIMSNKLIIDAPSVLISRLNPRFNRTWWAVPVKGMSALASTEFSCLSADTDANRAALWLAVRDNYFRSELAHRVTGTSGSHQRIRPDDMLSIEVPDTRWLPEKTKLEVLALLNLIHLRRSEIQMLAALRDGLLPELLSDRVCVPEGSEAYHEVVA